MWISDVIGAFLEAEHGQGLVARIIRSSSDVVYVRFEMKAEGALPTATVTRRWPLRMEPPQHRPYEEVARIVEELRAQNPLGLGVFSEPED